VTTGPRPSVGRVVVVGSLNVDIVVSVPRLPGPGETVVGGERRDVPGGKGANQAAAAARRGASVVMVGAVGSDPAGRLARAALAAEGVGTAGILERLGVPTGTALVVVDPTGENQIAVAPGANAALSGGEVADALRAADLRPSDVCVVGFEVGDPAVAAAAAAARAAGCELVVNPAPARPLPAELGAGRMVLVPNEPELAGLLAWLGELDEPGTDPSGDAGSPGRASSGRGELSPEARAAALAALAGRLRRRVSSTDAEVAVVVTAGALGAVLVAAGAEWWVPAPPVAVVDTTGAGDAFVGALAAARATGAVLPRAVEEAVVVASASVGVPGARGVPTGPLPAGAGAWALSSGEPRPG